MEITRKVELWPIWVYDARQYVFDDLVWNEHATLNRAYGLLKIQKSKNCTLGWRYDPKMEKEDLFTWVYGLDKTIIVTFHNLEDIRDLLKEGS